ncbi:MAG: hypothetical protein L6R39_001170 [Caloplaca ligustica]|nr:MAG: hypothetical protein L6R39_001170 [Caloplaca ligustica]
MAYFQHSDRTTPYQLPLSDRIVEVPIPSHKHGRPRHAPPFPKPPASQTLDAAGLRSRIAYVNTLQERKGVRKISDRTMAFLTKIKQQCTTALSMPCGKKKEELKAAISIDESMLESVHEKIHGQEGLCQKLVESVEAMAEVRMSAEYGDYLSWACKELKAENMGAMIWRKPLNRDMDWQAVNRVIALDEEALRQHDQLERQGIKEPLPDTPWFKSVAEAAIILRKDRNHVRHIIEAYAKRNAVCHNSVEQMVKECDWPGLAQRLVRDKANLNWFFRNDPHGQLKMRGVLVHLQQKYFTHCYGNADRPIYGLTDEAVRRMNARAARNAPHQP